MRIHLLIAALFTAALSAVAAAQPTTEQKIELLTEEIEQLRKEVRDKARSDSSSASGSTSQAAAARTTIGGYGELHYNNLDSKNELDFHRFVLFFGHRFTDRIRFFSEIELEHALVEDTDDGSGPGEVELEQAYIDFQLTDRHVARGGLFLIPVGILNETHEPNTFYGVERNPIESNIVPTTWWEGGAAIYGQIGERGWSYDAAITSGLAVPTTGTSAYLIRSGRQKVAKAVANDGAFTARLKWSGLPGLQWALTAHYQSDLTQGLGAPGTESSATLVETHVVFERGPFALRALYAQWDLDGSGPEAIGRDRQKGYYVEPSYKITPSVGVFARYNEWDNEAGDTVDSKKKQTDVGVNFWPHEYVVIKFDAIKQSGAVDDEGFNVGLGFMF